MALRSVRHFSGFLPLLFFTPSNKFLHVVALTRKCASAHPLLCSFEDSFMAEHGRGWLPEDNANRARTFVRVLGVFDISA